MLVVLFGFGAHACIHPQACHGACRHTAAHSGHPAWDAPLAEHECPICVFMAICPMAGLGVQPMTVDAVHGATLKAAPPPASAPQSLAAPAPIGARAPPLPA